MQNKFSVYFYKRVPTHLFKKEKIIYVEIPKCGCTSVKFNLKETRGLWAEKTLKNFHTWFGYTWVKPIFIKHFIRKHKQKGWKTFTVVRNPYERFLSLYRDPAKGHWKRTLDDFINNFSSLNLYLADPHAIPQHILIGNNISIYDFVGRTEDFDQVYKYLQENFNTKINRDHMYKGRVETGQVLTQEQANKIYQLYKKDFLLLGYNKNDFPTEQSKYNMINET